MRPIFRKLELFKDRFLHPGAPIWSTAALTILAGMLIAVIAWKADRSAFVPGTKGQDDHVAHFDFGYASYFPVRDLLAGNNPYDVGYSERNPDGESFPPYSPLHLGLHIPFGLTNFETARWIYFGCNLGLILVAACLVVRIIDPKLGRNAVLLVAVLMLASRPGYKTLFYGQETPLVMIGCYLALWKARSRPWLAALGLALVSVKIQFVVPLGVLMLFRGNFPAVWRGAVLAVAGAAIPLAMVVMNEGDLKPTVEGFYENYVAVKELPGVHQVGAVWARVDLSAQLAVLTGVRVAKGGMLGIAIGLWALGGLVLLRTRDREDVERADGASSALIIGLTVLSVYHLIYDFLILALPLCAALYRGAPIWKRIRMWQWVVVVFGLGLCFANHLIQKIALGVDPETLLWRLGVSANSMALLVALGVLGWLLLKAPKTRPTILDRSR